jgi:general stress protein YciG
MASKRGFASMDAAKQREIASKGGRAAHAKGTAHEFTPDEARVAGRKGGEAVSRDRAHMSAIGREGGHSRGARARAAATTGNPSSPAPTSPTSQDQSSSQRMNSGSFSRNESDSRPAYHADNRDRVRTEERGDRLSGNGSFNDRDEN